MSLKPDDKHLCPFAPGGKCNILKELAMAFPDRKDFNIFTGKRSPPIMLKQKKPMLRNPCVYSNEHECWMMDGTAAAYSPACEKCHEENQEMFDKW